MLQPQNRNKITKIGVLLQIYYLVNTAQLGYFQEKFYKNNYQGVPL